LHELNDGVVRLENVSNWSTEELGLQDIFAQVDRFAVQEQEHIEFFSCARACGIDYGTSTFTKRDVDFCVDQKVANLKVASCDVTNLDLIEYVLSKDYATHIALGMASMAEIEAIVNMIPEKCRPKVTLLHCVSLYPPNDQLVNLRFMRTLHQCTGMNVGYSDHTLGFEISLAAMALGATVLEKHFTLDKDMPGWDHRVSADPYEMEIICRAAKRISLAVGTGVKYVSEDELAKRLKFRRSIALVHSLKAGDMIRYDDIAFKRPGTGISADRFQEIIGRRVNRDIEADTTLFWEDLIK
jgi:N-acetylneuraminate synthase